MDKPALGEFIRSRREGLKLGLRDLSRLTEQKKLCGQPVSPGYLSQVESGEAPPEKVGMDVLWAIGTALGVDPLKLHVMSRPWLDAKYVESKERDRLFSIR